MNQITNLRKFKIEKILKYKFKITLGGADRNLDTLTSKNDYAKRSFIF